MPNNNSLRISIIGAGTGGAHAVNFMRTAGYRDVALAIIDTGRATQYQWKLPQHIQTESLPPVTWFSAPVGGRLRLDVPASLVTLLKNSHAVFIVAGMGGQTGMLLAEAIVNLCLDLQTLTVAVVTMPFRFEGAARRTAAQKGLDMLHRLPITTIALPGDQLRNGSHTAVDSAVGVLRLVQQTIMLTITTITDLLLKPNLVGMDLADVRSALKGGGMAHVGFGSSSGANRAVEAAERALAHPLMADADLGSLKLLLMTMKGSSEVTLDELSLSYNSVLSNISDDTESIWGAITEKAWEDTFWMGIIGLSQPGGHPNL